MKRAEKKDHLIDTAIALFREGGYHGTGVDEIIARAGIAKTTLYRHFPSKDDLIVAALERLDESFRDDMRAFVDAAGGPPVARLLATFDFLEAWFDSGDFNGCPFVSAASEYSDSRNPILQAARVHKRLVLAYLEELVRAAGLANPKALAAQINLLHEGAVAVMHIERDRAAAAGAKRAAELLVGNAAQAAEA